MIGRHFVKHRAVSLAEVMVAVATLAGADQHRIGTTAAGALLPALLGPAVARWALNSAATAGPASGSLPAPARLGRYQVIGELGRGGMGVVYRGHDRALNRPVALKVLSRALFHVSEQLGLEYFARRFAPVPADRLEVR